MTETLKADMTLDLRGLLCPLPVVKIAQAVKKVELNQTVEATATDPGVLADIPAWARSSGHELISINRVDGSKDIRFLVKRLK